jgi:hypothetical protein
MISVSINVSKIDKSHFYEGKNGKILNLILWETPNDKFGNAYRVDQGVSKEARLKGIKGPILGNAKVFGQAATSAPSSEEAF